MNYAPPSITYILIKLIRSVLCNLPVTNTVYLWFSSSVFHLLLLPHTSFLFWTDLLPKCNTKVKRSQLIPIPHPSSLFCRVLLSKCNIKVKRSQPMSIHILLPLQSLIHNLTYLPSSLFCNLEGLFSFILSAY